MRNVFLVCAVAVLVAACAAPQPSGSASSARTTSATGAISGRLSYPSEFLPGQAIYAIPVSGPGYYKVESVAYQGRYTILSVPPGDYFVFAVARFGSAQDRFRAGYTKAVPCGLDAGCTDHSAIPVHVDAGRTTPGIDPSDWYADLDQFPLIPDGPTSIASPPPVQFDSADATAQSFGQARLQGRYVTTQADCTPGAACFWFVSRVDGHSAGYFVAYAGSNQDLVRCALYVVQDGASWRYLDLRCNDAERGVFPSLNERGRVQLGMGETGCVRVHESPGLSAKVVACLNAGTGVTIDQGPYYSPTVASAAPNGPSQVDVWWHLAGSGWMVHQYLGAAAS